MSMSMLYRVPQTSWSLTLATQTSYLTEFPQICRTASYTKHKTNVMWVAEKAEEAEQSREQMSRIHLCKHPSGREDDGKVQQLLSGASDQTIK